MVRIVTLTKSLSLWVFPNDHAPPHFHIRSPETDALIDMRTLQVMEGTYKRRQLVEALAWAAKPENSAILWAEWRRLNEQD